MTDTVGMGRRFVRDWIGGPLVGTIQILGEHRCVLAVIEDGRELGRYVRSNIGWLWHEEPTVTVINQPKTPTFRLFK